MKFYLLLVMIVLVAGCASTKSVVGDQQLLSQSLELEKLSDQNKITVEMLMAFKEKLAGDPFAEDLASEAIWLVRYNEYEHSAHSLNFLALYIKDGTKLFCPGHEIAHVQLFAEHNDFELLNGTIQGIEDSYPKWKADAYARREKFPAFYKKLDQIVSTIDEILPKIKAGNYNIDSEVTFLEENDIC